MQTYIAEVINQGDTHRVRLGKPDNRYSAVEFAAAFNHDAVLTVNNQTTTLGELAEKLVGYQEADLKMFFSERGQLDIGRYLFGQLFGGMDKNERKRLSDAAVDLRIVAENEVVARLPWSLLYDSQRFLAVTGWTVSLSTPPEDWKNVELPPSPRIMVVMPQPNEWAATSAEEHLQELERILSNVNSLHVCGRHLYLVKTWEDFQEQLPEVLPHVLYFYGHGSSDTTNSHLIFAARGTNVQINVSATELTNFLRSLGSSAPRLAYINCCLGDAGGLLGVGRQIREVIPAVITNCTMAEIDTAQTQALDIWRSILLDGLSPHEAVAAMRKNLGGQQAGGLNNARWLAPIVHCSYRNWEFKPPRSYDNSIDPNWEYTLDRIVPTGVAMLLTGNMIRIGKPRALVFVWYGKEFQGVEEFYKRLEIEIQNQFKEVNLYSPPPLEFPAEFHEFDRSIRDMLAQAFDEDNYNMVANKIRIEAKNIGRRPTLIYFRHPVIRKGMELNRGEQLRNYVEWLDANFVGQMSANVFALIGLPFITEEPPKFSTGIKKLFEGVRHNNLMLRLLNELGEIEYEDLENFFDMHNIYLPRANRKKILDSIMEKTNGQYQNALEELKLLKQNGAWNYSRENSESNIQEIADDEL